MAAQATRPPATRPPVASFEISSWLRTRTGRQLQPITRHIILALAGYVNGKSRNAHPGMRRLAEDTGYTKDTICKRVAIIEAIGLVTVTKTTRTNEYAWHGTRGIDAQVDRVLAEHPEWSHRRSKPARDAAPDAPPPAAPVLVSGADLAADARREHAPVVVPEPAPAPAPVSVTPAPDSAPVTLTPEPAPVPAASRPTFASRRDEMVEYLGTFQTYSEFDSWRNTLARTQPGWLHPFDSDPTIRAIRLRLPSKAKSDLIYG